MPTREQLIGVTIVGLVIFAAVTAAVVYYTLRIHGSGTIKLIGLEAYGNPEGTQVISSVNWGELTPGGVSQVVLYLKSTSTAPATLTLSTEAWDPPTAGAYITLEWDYDGSALQPGEIRGVLFTLRVSESVIGITSFAFDFVIVASG